MLLQSKGGYRPDLSDVFTIGIIMMEAACLFPMADLYEEDHNYINSDKIKERLSIIEGRYSFKLRFLIEKMLRADPKQRISLVDIEHTIQSESFEEDESRSGGVPYSSAPT
jgi:serine/threonine protein kinase